MVLGLGLGSIEGHLFLLRLTVYISCLLGVLEEKKRLELGTKLKDLELGVTEFDSDILIFCTRVILQPVPLLQVAYPGLTDMCRHL